MLPGDKIFVKRSKTLNRLGQLGNINWKHITVSSYTVIKQCQYQKTSLTKNPDHKLGNNYSIRNITLNLETYLSTWRRHH